MLPRNEIEKRLGERMVCLCGGCGKEPIGTCTCSTAAGVRREIATLVDSGKSEDQIVEYFIAKYGGQQFLGAPVDEGFNRLAWLFPYLLGASGAVVVGLRRRSLVAQSRQGAGRRSRRRGSGPR